MTHEHHVIHRRLLFLLALSGALGALFFYDPYVDLFVSHALYAFHHAQEGNLYQKTLHVLRRLNFLFLYASIGWGVVSVCLTYRQKSWKKFKKRAYILSCLIVAGSVVPDFLTKPIFKRSRPGKVIQFMEEYTPPFHIGKRCRSNCSFVSGEVAAATSMISFWVVMGRFRVLWLIVSGFWVLVVAAVRMAQIGHFLSDVVFACLFSLLAIEGLRYFFGVPDHDK